MASLQWIALGAVVGFEALLVLVVSLPLHRNVRAWLVPNLRPILQPMLAVVPFALFQLLDVYWKYEHKMRCEGVNCTAADRDRYEKSMIKNQRNLIVAIAAAFLYWVLWRWFKVATHILLLEQEVKKLKQT